MRHLRSILYALVLAPAAWVLTGVGFTDDLHGRGRQYSGVESFTGLLLLLLAGAAYAILVFAPISPAGPTLFGLAFLAASGWALAAPSSYASIWPSGVTKPSFDLSRPGYGLAALLAVPLISTALSVRRWERYEPPQLPLIGTWGRPRGAASVAEGPVAAESTQIIPQTGPDGDATQGTSEEPTAASASEKPTADVVGAESVAADPPAADSSTADQPAADQPAADQPAADQPAADQPAAVESEPAEAAPAQIEAAAESTQAGAGATQAEAGIESSQPETADERNKSAETIESSDKPAGTTEPIAADVEPEKRTVGERTATITTSDQDKTQIIRLPVSEMPTRDLRMSPGERTQVIRVPQQRTDSADGERTQVIRLPTGTVEPPADRTQAPQLPAAPGETATEETAPAKPGRPPSIIAQERPDPGADPTTRLGAPPPAPATKADPGDGTTADVGNRKRAMTVMNLERPAGEAADDTRPVARPRTPPEPDETGRPT